MTGVPDVVEVAPGAPFELSLQGYTGIRDTLRISLVQAGSEAVVLAPTAAGITEPVPNLFVWKSSAAPVTEGRYRAIWTGFPEEPAVQDILVTSMPAVRPQVASVAKLLRPETRNAGGLSVLTFDATTRPTGEEVDEMIDTAMDSVVPTLSAAAIEAEFRSMTRFLVTIKAGMLVELSRKKDQTGGQNRSMYDDLAQLYKDEQKALKAAINDRGDGSPDGAAGMPSHSFDPCPPPMEW